MSAELKRKSYSIKEKLEIIDKIHSGISTSKIKKDFGIPHGTIRGWILEENKLRSFTQKLDETSGLGRKKTRLGKNQAVEERLYTWFLQRRKEGLPVSGSTLKCQAEKFHKEMNLESEFTASDGWLWRWQKRHGIGNIKINGESRSNNKHSEEQFLGLFQKCVKDEEYSDEQIYNCNETDLCYQMLPNKELDIKLSKDKITLLFCTNKTGNHKLPPLVIGKSQSSRCLKNLNMQQSLVLYKNSLNARMTSDIFLDWFNNGFVPSVQTHLRSLDIQSKALLLLNNCPAHLPAENLISRDGNIKVLYLPALIQPLEQGIIDAFKVNYREELSKSLVSSDEEITRFLNSIGIAWESVSSNLISNCWKKISQTTLESSSENMSCNEDQREELEEPEISETDTKTWFSIDKTEPVCQILTDKDIIGDVRNEKVDAAPNTREALKCLDTVIRWVEGHKNDVRPLTLLHLATLKKDMLDSVKKQKKITDYFHKLL